MRIPLVSLALAVPGAALAQQAADPQRDQEYRDIDLDLEDEKRVLVSASVESQWHEYNNVDFLARDESSDQAILDTDDRGAFAFTGIAADVSVRVDDAGKTRFVTGLTHRGLWGDDQIGKINAFSSLLYFTGLYLEHTFGNDYKLVIGRQFLELGGIADTREFILSDTLDLIRLDVPISDKGRLVFIPINVIGAAPDPNDVTLLSYVGQNSDQIFGMRGDTMNRRHGLILQLDDLTENAELHGYAFYTDLGARGTGSDISYNGRLGNFVDNDWVGNAGARFQMSAGPVTPFVGADISTGIDRKELVAPDVNLTGFAGTAGLVVDTSDEEDETNKGFSAELSGFYATGASYDRNGMQFSHGYVGLKARHMGGTIANRYQGMHPTAYVGFMGISDTQHDYDRKSGSMVVHANGGYDFGAVRARVAWWLMGDTGLVHPDLDFDNLDLVNPPFGYSREEFAAHERLGRLLGQEINFDLSAQATDALAFSFNAAVFLPGSFYDIPVGRVAGEALGGDSIPAWSLNAGTRVRF